MTNSVPGLGWPEDTPASSAEADDRASDDDAEAWLESLSGDVERPDISGDIRVVSFAAAGALPGRYARRAARLGLGWPSGGSAADASDAGSSDAGSSDAGSKGLGSGRARPPDAASEHAGDVSEIEHSRRPESDEDPGRTAVEGALGSRSAADAGAPPPARVRQALASVSRETVSQPGSGTGSPIRHPRPQPGDPAQPDVLPAGQGAAGQGPAGQGAAGQGPAGQGAAAGSGRARSGGAGSGRAGSGRAGCSGTGSGKSGFPGTGFAGAESSRGLGGGGFGGNRFVGGRLAGKRE